MARKLERKRAVITGASSGVGRAIARAFGAEGAGVALIARDAEGLEAAAFEIRSAGGSAMTFVADVADAGALELAADQVAAEWGGIDIWVNDAMESVFAPVDEITPDEYRRVTEVNYLGYVFGTRAALKHMRRQQGGVILQIGSAVAYRSIPLQSAYAGSKAAIRAFTDSLRSELIHERSKIKICHLQLPAVNTPQFDVVRNKLGDHPHPVPPVYQPEIIAAAAVKAALRPKREVWIGFSTFEAIVGQRLIPGFLDRYLARKAWGPQKTRRLPPGHPRHHRADNLDGPVPGDKGAHGPFDAEARSPQRERRLRVARSVALGAVAVALVGFLVRRATA